MEPIYILLCFIAYTIMLFVITWITSRRTNNDSYYVGNKSSPWYVVAYGMIGASLSGVTFMSVPGLVGTQQFTYLGLVFGFLIGYTVIATVLLPLYYRLNLTSIYGYLNQRFGFWSYKTGAFYFLLSRVVGASFRMFLVVNVLQVFVFDYWGVPFWLVVSVFIILIILYTFEGGVKTIIWTDTLQTTFMLLGVILSIYFISNELGIGLGEIFTKISDAGYTRVVETDWHSKNFFLKQFFSGAFIAIVMTGLDQEMMQKNISCRNIKEAQKNMFTFSGILVIVNIMFLTLGAVLYMYASAKGIGIPTKTDNLFPEIAFNHLGPIAGLVFMIGLVSAAYPSADGALTALTTSFCVDFLGFKDKSKLDEKQKKKVRYAVHLSFAAILLIVILIFRALNNEAVINAIYTAAGYTYGPLLGLFAFGLFTKYAVKDGYVWIVAIISPVLCYFLSMYSEILFNGYKFGFELLILNGLLTFTGLFILRKRTS
ncbi:MAG TPA: sodium:solute symporter [Bacteroidales bacterium]|jgi:Na+/proline symporter|nr:sodium:solute symporter [Bacteroidales bacterium]HPB25685.1 sodium:solute symporter [Bacteroidales bacterium]HPI31022.1 sodium:solute symporter [Bacteroidales bacterium]HQN16252.1 sodium:solute symporter [Bacteroidales bacterium]HQP15840.1 sodium:solute symporter [Bacteroidales bacterium]